VYCGKQTYLSSPFHQLPHFKKGHSVSQDMRLNLLDEIALAPGVPECPYYREKPIFLIIFPIFDFPIFLKILLFLILSIKNA
jgi:hypothetical protein